MKYPTPVATPTANRIEVSATSPFVAVSIHPTHPWAMEIHRTATDYSECFLLQFYVSAALIRRGLFRAPLIKLYFLAYFEHRFATEFIRPSRPEQAAPDQIAALIFLPIFVEQCFRARIAFRSCQKAPGTCDDNLVGMVWVNLRSPHAANLLLREGRRSFRNTRFANEFTGFARPVRKSAILCNRSVWLSLRKVYPKQTHRTQPKR